MTNGKMSTREHQTTSQSGAMAPRLFRFIYELIHHDDQLIIFEFAFCDSESKVRCIFFTRTYILETMNFSIVLCLTIAIVIALVTIMVYI